MERIAIPYPNQRIPCVAIVSTCARLSHISLFQESEEDEEDEEDKEKDTV